MKKFYNNTFLTKKIKLIDRKKYTGIGRPKKSDYEYKSIVDLQNYINELYNKKI